MKVVNEDKIMCKETKHIKLHMNGNNGISSIISNIIKCEEMGKSIWCSYLVYLKDGSIIEYTGKGNSSMNDIYIQKFNFCKIAILGNIVCGYPEKEEERIKGYLPIPEEWVRGECFLLQVQGDSMVDVGIEDNDLVLVRKNALIKEGQIVVALTENGNTLKRLKYDAGKPILIAENASYPKERRIISPKKLKIQGVALKVIKKLRCGGLYG